MVAGKEGQLYAKPNVPGIGKAASKAKVLNIQRMHVLHEAITARHERLRPHVLFRGGTDVAAGVGVAGNSGVLGASESGGSGGWR